MSEEKSASAEHTDEDKEKKKSEDATILDDDELKNLPPEVKLMISQSRYMGLMPNPIAAKVNETHITTILENSERDSEREYKSNIHQKYFNGFLVIITVLLIIFLTVFLARDNTDLYKYILTAFLSFLGGFGGGYGYRSMKKKE